MLLLPILPFLLFRKQFQTSALSTTGGGNIETADHVQDTFSLPSQLGDYTDAVDCMIRYLYTLDYEPEVIFGLSGQSVTVEIINKADTDPEIGDHRTPVEEITLPHDSEAGDAHPSDL
ncbi:hypothetical protein LTR06_011350, partial [Exophiala xenobiotica]